MELLRLFKNAWLNVCSLTSAKNCLFSSVSLRYILAVCLLIPVLTSVSLDAEAFSNNCPVFYVNHQGKRSLLFTVNSKGKLRRVKTINKPSLHLAVNENSSTLFFISEKTGELFRMKGKSFKKVAGNLPKGIVALVYDSQRDVLFGASRKTNEVYVIFQDGKFQSLGEIKSPNGKSTLHIPQDGDLAIDNKGKLFVLANESGKKPEIFEVQLHEHLGSKYFKKGLYFPKSTGLVVLDKGAGDFLVSIHNFGFKKINRKSKSVKSLRTKGCGAIGDLGTCMKPLCKKNFQPVCGSLFGKPKDPKSEKSVKDAWSQVTFYTKTIDAPNFNSNKLSSFTFGGAFFNTGREQFGVGIAGPNDKPPRNEQINFIAEENRSERLVIDFGECGDFNRAEITLAGFYGLENGFAETGRWIAYDRNFKEITSQSFIAIEPLKSGNPGLFDITLVTGFPFRFLEFQAGPYGESFLKDRQFMDNSDFFVQTVKVQCVEPINCDDVLGGVNFDNWIQSAIQVQPNGSPFPINGDASIFVKGNNDLEGGLGVPGENGDFINDGDFVTIFTPNVDNIRGVTDYAFEFNFLEEGEKGQIQAFKIVNGERVIVDFIVNGKKQPFLDFEGSNFLNQKNRDSRSSTTTGMTSDPADGFTLGGGTAGFKDGKERPVSFVLNEFIPCPECSGATKFSDFKQGRTKNGSKIQSSRSNPVNALGTPEDDDSQASLLNFVSLGFGGSIVLEFPSAFDNGPGDDLRFFETSFEDDGFKGIRGDKNFPEKADVFVSQDGECFLFVGTAFKDDAFFDLDDVGLDWAKYVKIVDVSDPGRFSKGSADGYDVDGVTCLNGLTNAKNPLPLKACSAQQVISYNPGVKKDGKALPQSRRNPKEALGNPNSFDSKNKFVALGIKKSGSSKKEGGSIILGFDCAIFDYEGLDLIVHETSFGNPNFANFPEQAKVFVSKYPDKGWKLLGVTGPKNPNSDCKSALDGAFDFEGITPWAQYVKIVDITDPNAKKRNSSNCKKTGTNAFNNASDGFDVDAVTCYEGGEGAKSNEVVILPMSEDEFEVFPNPAVGQVKFDFSNAGEFALPESEQAVIEVFDANGNLVDHKEQVIDHAYTVGYDFSKLPKGLYIIKIRTDNVIRQTKIMNY